MIVTLRLFSVLREALGSGLVEVELEEGTTGAELVELLAENQETVKRLQSVIRLAIKDEYVNAGITLNDGDEVAFVTPVSGG
jgi:molybdopterin converting factor small subunit